MIETESIEEEENDHHSRRRPNSYFARRLEAKRGHWMWGEAGD